MDPILEEELFRELSRRLAQGHSSEQMAREMDYPQSFLEQLLMREDFQHFFSRQMPEAYAAWRRARDEEAAEMEVIHYLRSQSLHNAKALQRLADGDNLKPGEKLSALRELLKMSGTVKDDTVVEVVRLSKEHLAALNSTAKELDS